MANGRTTSNKGLLIIGMLMGLSFVIFGGLELYNEIQVGEPQWALLLMIGIGVLAFIVCIKGYIVLIKKKKIKKNKELMRKTEAKVVGFEAWNDNHRDHMATSYYFNASDGIETYSSEEFHATVVGGCGNITETLKMMKIPYNPEKPEGTIKALNDRLNQIEIELQQHSGPKALLLKGAYTVTQSVKQRLESGEIPYMEFGGHKLYVGDQVNVYIDPEDPSNYWIDTDFLYT